MRKFRVAGALVVMGWCAAAWGQQGIAEKYPNDVGIGRDPNVLIAEDYELPNVKALEAKGWSWANWGLYGLSGQGGAGLFGTGLVKYIKAGQHGAIMPCDLKKGEEVVYHRVYTKFPTVPPSTRVMGITGVPEGTPTWKAIGTAGVRANGTNDFCVTLLSMDRGGQPVPMWYPYHMDQTGAYGDNWYVEGTTFPVGRWFCMEMMVKMNTPGKKDGELRLWLDGKEVYTKVDMRYRSIPNMKIMMIFDQNYSSQGFQKDYVFFADNRVVARKYVGPIKPVGGTAPSGGGEGKLSPPPGWEGGEKGK